MTLIILKEKKKGINPEISFVCAMIQKTFSYVLF